MKITLDELPHQEKALAAIMASFPGLDEQPNGSRDADVYANPIVTHAGEDVANIDVKMETGTGKTYVGVRTMYELHRRFGLFKFVVVVPSPAIKAGWKNFITADYAKRHFGQFYENVNVNLNVINAGDFKAKSGRSNMPAQLIDFVEGSRLNQNTIEVLLINAGMLASKSLTKAYDQTLLSGWTTPIDAIVATRPVVLMDEPHRFPRGKAFYQAVELLKPQSIIRLGATFPEVKVGRGKNAQLLKDYYRNEPQFNLNAVDAFNHGLVKAIDIYYPNVSKAAAADKWVVDSVKAKTLVLKQGPTLRTVGVGDDLGFDGNITYEGGKVLSNGLELEKGMTFLPATMTASYQEMIIREAIDHHFAAEITNFMRENDNQAKVKTLSLFFIDSIRSYRGEPGEHAWLKDLFEKLLNQKLTDLIQMYRAKTQPREREYLSFLQATLANLTTDVHAGYFGEDRGSGDEGIQKEVDDILVNKEKLLSFKDDNGHWNTRRFLFSKWTLREGWDNPNVFMIAKLRTSGSETSKLQEVGRGLRLPVDENGHRLLQSELRSRLRFLIGYDERDFAQKLVNEVNSDTALTGFSDKLTVEMIDLIVEKQLAPDEATLLKTLRASEIIKQNRDFEPGGFAKLLELYPLLREVSLVKHDRITTNGPQSKQRVALNQDNWNRMRALWQTFSQRFMLKFRPISDDALQAMVNETMQGHDAFVLQSPEFTRGELYASDEDELLQAKEQTVAENIRQPLPGMPYGLFLRKLSDSTKLPVAILHRALVPVLKNVYNSDTRYLNELTLSNLARQFKVCFAEKYAQAFEYQALAFQASTSVYDAKADTFKTDVSAEAIGVNEDDQVLGDQTRQLYEMPPMRYDSVHPEKELLTHEYDAKVTAFGKLPRRAIQVPKYTGGTTTPDFVYVIEDENKQAVYLLVETKAENKRVGDAQIVNTHRQFFEQLRHHHIAYEEAVTANEVYAKIKGLEQSDQ
ncbi:type III restriction-modification system endonuclease [Furfurilactobacillus sp. WILCCON 0119]